jgi:hypothetical protein
LVKVGTSRKLVRLRISSARNMVFSREIVDGDGGLGVGGSGVWNRCDDAGGHCQTVRVGVVENFGGGNGASLGMAGADRASTIDAAAVLAARVGIISTVRDPVFVAAKEAFA